MKITQKLQSIRVETIIVVLFLATVLILLASYFLDKRTVTFSPQNTHGARVTAVSDMRDGGFSVAHLTTMDDHWLVKYELKEGRPYPFGMLQLDFTDSGKGLDLSHFEQVVLQVEAKDPGSKRVRVQFRNFHKDYAALNDPLSLKYNEVHLPSTDINKRVVLPWKYFHVASWWIGQRRIPTHHGHLDVSNVYWMQILSPEAPPLGNGEIKVKYVSFEGKWVSETTLFKFLLGMWIMVLLLYLLGKLVEMKQRLQKRIHQASELRKMNSVLAIQAKELKTQATRDPLTGLLNRFGLREQLYPVIRNVKRESIALSAILCDIDYFKKVNDTKGHDEGDRILKVVSGIFQQNVRNSDLLCRWGGEEFLFFCPATQMDGGCQLAEKLRARLSESGENVTCSFGVAELQNGSLDNLIKRADKALYAAKENGRDCVYRSEEQPDGTIRTSLPGTPW